MENVVQVRRTGMPGWRCVEKTSARNYTALSDFGLSKVRV